MAETDNSPFLTELYIVLLAVASAALVIAVYHCLSVIRWNQQQIHRIRRRGGAPQENEDRYSCSTIENSMVELIPAHKHRKNMVLDGEDGTCPICLSEFEEGEELRTLPECLHSFHAPCIDMWFYSHFNCPMCRTDATPSPSPRIQIINIPDSGTVSSMPVDTDLQTMSV